MFCPKYGLIIDGDVTINISHEAMKEKSLNVSSVSRYFVMYHMTCSL